MTPPQNHSRAPIYDANTPCMLCDGEVFSILSDKDRHGQPLQSVICDGCGLVMNRPIPDEKELIAFYAETYRRMYKKTIAPKRKHHIRYFSRAVAQIMPHQDIYRDADAVLDIGSGSGEFAALMKTCGKYVQCIEPTREYADYTRRVFDLSVFCGSVYDFAPPPKRQFDFIRINHVLEHLRAPINTMSLVRNWLTDDGIVCVAVPDFISYCRNKTPGNIFHYGHIYNYDCHTLSAMLAKAHFTPVRRAADTDIYCCKKESTPVINPQNADNNKHFYMRHLNGEFVRGKKSKKIFGKIGKILKEQWQSATLGSPRQIAAHYAKIIQ